MMFADLEMIGEGATTKVYRDGEKAVKLYVNAPPNEADNEAKLQSFAYNAGLPVPAVYGVRKISESLTALDMAYIPGEPLIRKQMDKDERRNAINTLAKLQCIVHGINANGLCKQTDKLAWKIEHSAYLERPLKDSLLDLLLRLDSNSSNLCHGDFHPLNVLYDHNEYWIIDWVDATAGNPLADACRTYLIFKQYLSRSAGIYLRSFCKEANVKQEDVLVWLPLVAAARLGENMVDEGRAFLMEILNAWNRPKGEVLI